MKKVRLSPHIVPLKYNIELEPDLKNFVFSGIENIDLLISKSTKNITLHSREIDIDTAHVIVGKNKIFAKNISYDPKAQTATLVFPEPISAKKARLTLAFRGILNDKMRGFYRSRYSVGEKEYHLATTQFEATDARRAFPCFDEPSKKAVFDVSLIVEKGQTAISNTLPVSVAEHRSGFEIIRFSPTPKMSTYLLAFIVGDLEYLTGTTANGTEIRVFTTPGKKHQAQFSLTCAIRTLEFYEEYFDIRFPLPGLDMIAIPDFASGAMENWGAITYRESALLVDEEKSSAGNKQWVALVVAHELAHQWFGNLVTMEWWTHLWLNEGFASFIEYLAVDKLFPEWDIWTQFSTSDLGIALRLDSLSTTHPIEVEVHNPDEIGEIFDEVSYSKGASVIRMLAEYLGEKDFRNGLRYYLKKHSYKNTETIHLWEAFEKISKKPVARMMRNWTSKSGYPVVKARTKGSTLFLSQERFFASPISKAKSKEKTIWHIPITTKTPAGIEKNFLTSASKKIFLFKHDNSIKLLPNENILSGISLKLNLGETGFYRTQYSQTLLENLRLPVSKKDLSPRDRLGIIRDLFALAEAGTLSGAQALQFLSAYKEEDNYTVWLEIASGLARLEQIFAKTKLENKIKELARELFEPVALSLGWDKKEGETHADTLLRSLSISMAGRSGSNKIIKEARKRFRSLENGAHLSPDTRGAIYSVIATWGKLKEHRKLISMYKSETLHEEKNRIGNALGDFQNKELLKKTLEFAISSYVRIQDTVGILSSAGGNPLGRDLWWDFVKKNWKILVSRYGEGGLTLGRAVKAINGSAEEKHLKAFKKFFETNEAPGAKRSIEQAIERMEGNILWQKRDKKNIEVFFNKNF